MRFTSPEEEYPLIVTNVFISYLPEDKKSGRAIHAADAAAQALAQLAIAEVAEPGRHTKAYDAAKFSFKGAAERAGVKEIGDKFLDVLDKQLAEDIARKR